MFLPDSKRALEQGPDVGGRAEHALMFQGIDEAIGAQCAMSLFEDNGGATEEV